MQAEQKEKERDKENGSKTDNLEKNGIINKQLLKHEWVGKGRDLKRKGTRNPPYDCTYTLETYIAITNSGKNKLK